MMAAKNAPANAGKISVSDTPVIDAAANAIVDGAGSAARHDLKDGAGSTGVETATVAEPVITSVALLTKAGEVLLKPGDTLIVCASPNFRRAGIEHPAFAVYPPGTWTEAQMTLLRGEPKLKVVVVS